MTQTPPKLLALRGATTCDQDSADEIETKTRSLVSEMLDRNQIHHDDLVSILFTATSDLHALFPATAARGLGLGDVPLICAQELEIVGGMPMCIRVMMHFYGRQERSALHHIYLEGARALRDDLPS